MAKGNIRSIRISDQMAELIDRQAGNNFTEKWENLVTRCTWELPHKEQELAAIQQRIDNAREQLRDLTKQKQQITKMQSILNNAQWYIEELEKLTQPSNTN